MPRKQGAYSPHARSSSYSTLDQGTHAPGPAACKEAAAEPCRKACCTWQGAFCYGQLSHSKALEDLMDAQACSVFHWRALGGQSLPCDFRGPSHPHALGTHTVAKGKSEAGHSSLWSQNASCLEGSSGAHLERGFSSHGCWPADDAIPPPKNSLLCLQPWIA